MLNKFLVPRNKKVELKKHDPDFTGHYKNKDEVSGEYTKLKLKLEKLQDTLFAEKKHSILIILQGMDCSGKDGVVKNVMSTINPNGVLVSNFKNPTLEENAHDFLWRVHKLVPAKGYIAAFNRSYYEDVLITRVHKLISDEEADNRFKHINHFEELMTDNHVTFIKIFLNISKEFQIIKIKDRLQDPHKRWKFDKNDLTERKYWVEYQEAYEDVFKKCNKQKAPWFIVPANNRWFRDFIVLKIVVNALEQLNMSYPNPDLELKNLMKEIMDTTNNV